jgi:hypothetical protein
LIPALNVLEVLLFRMLGDTGECFDSGDLPGKVGGDVAGDLVDFVPRFTDSIAETLEEIFVRDPGYL